MYTTHLMLLNSCFSHHRCRSYLRSALHPCLIRATTIEAEGNTAFRACYPLTKPSQVARERSRFIYPFFPKVFLQVTHLQTYEIDKSKTTIRQESRPTSGKWRPHPELWFSADQQSKFVCLIFPEKFSQAFLRYFCYSQPYTLGKSQD